VLRWIAGQVSDGHNTVETGLGVSTAVFALAGSNHTCLTRDDAEIDHFKDYARRAALNLDRIRFLAGASEDVLPGLDLAPIDVAVIDGGHGFPTPFLDWHFLAQRLKPGGVVIIDDMQLWPSYILAQFLSSQPGWSRLAVDFSNKTRGFVLEEAFSVTDWYDQPYVKKMSRPLVRRFLVKEALRLGAQGRFRELLLGLRDILRKEDTSAARL